MNKLFLRGLNFLGFIFSILAFYIFFEGFSAYLEKQGTLVTDELAFKGVLFTLSVSLFFSYCSLLLYMGDNILNIILSIKNKSKINLYSIITTTLSVIVNIMFFVSMEYNFSISNIYWYLTLNIFHIAIIVLQIITLFQLKKQKTELT